MLREAMDQHTIIKGSHRIRATEDRTYSAVTQGSTQAGHDGIERVADYSGTDIDGDYRH